MSILDKGLEQMERGMASEAGRMAVNAETMADRQRRAERRAERIAAIGFVPATPVAKSIQDGDFGRLD